MKNNKVNGVNDKTKKNKNDVLKDKINKDEKKIIKDKFFLKANGIKNFFKKKRNIVIVSVLALLLIIIILFLIFYEKEEKNKFVLSSIYDVFPEEVRELYTNTVSVSCKGDLYLPVLLDADATNVTDLDKTTLIDYVFSYLDKNDLLNDKTKKSDFDSAVDKLFVDEDIDLLDEIDEYVYGDYAYTYERGDKVIVREKSDACTSEKEYYSQLYGYSYNEEMLSVDINFGYKDGKNLYNLSGEKLGEFKDELNAQELFRTSSYYRYNFVKEKDTYKLISVEWMNRV